MAAKEAARSGAVQLLTAIVLNWGGSLVWVSHGSNISEFGIVFVACSFALAWYLPLRYCRGWEWLFLPICWLPSMLVFADLLVKHAR